jgi:uncharacterized membrane protein YkvA (DUF1232 family)
MLEKYEMPPKPDIVHMGRIVEGGRQQQMEQLEDKSIESARKHFIVSVVLVGLAIIYTIWPFDFIPDILFPVGYLDDIPVLIGTAVYAGYSYRKMKKERDRQNA